jgi:hypothetical protein
MTSRIINGRELTTVEGLIRTATSAWTQTYSTAARTVPAAVAVLTAGTDISSETASSKLEEMTTTFKATTTNNVIKSLQTKINAIVADNLAMKKAVTAIIDDLQAGGLNL